MKVSEDNSYLSLQERNNKAMNIKNCDCVVIIRDCKNNQAKNRFKRMIGNLKLQKV